MEVERPFPWSCGTSSVDADDGSTMTAIRATGSPGRFFGSATPLMRRQVHRSIAADLERLRSCLERRGPGATAT